MSSDDTLQPQKSQMGLDYWERIFLFIALTILFVFHFTLQMNVDAFWRDEVASLVLANCASWKEVWNHLVIDSFPGLWITILRTWKFIGMGAGDGWLHALGMVLSGAVLVALVASSKRMKIGLPVMAVALLGAIPAMFYWGDSLRAYALACALIALLYGWVWGFVEEGGIPLGLAGGVIAVLAAQSNYQNSYLIFGICVSGALVAALERNWRRSIAVLAMGAAAAASLLPYLKIIQAYQLSAPIQKGPKITLGLVWSKFSEGFEGVTRILLPILLLLALLVLIAPFLCRPGNASQGSQEENGEEGSLCEQKQVAEKRRRIPHKLIYSAAALFISGVSCYGFINFQGFPTNCWYYLPILTVTALSIETTLSFWMPNQKIRWMRLAVAAVAFFTSLPTLWGMANLRRTTMDLAAYRVAKEATEKDLVLVYPFFESESFSYYYKGQAHWTLLPVVPDDQRLDPMNAMMKLCNADNPLKPSFEEVSKTLQRGGRVWVVNGVPSLPKGIDLAKYEKPLRPAFAWQTWPMAIGSYLEKHATVGSIRKVQSELPVCHFENVQVIFVFSGWKE